MSIPASGSGSPCKTAADAATVGPVSSLKPLPGNAGYHGVHFYADETRLCLSVTDFIADGVVADQPVLVIATPAHRQLITAQLALRRFDVTALKVQRKAMFLDALTTMNKFMVSGNIDAARFHAVTGATITQPLCGPHGLHCPRLRRDGGRSVASRPERTGHRARASVEPTRWQTLLLVAVRVCDGPLLQGNGPRRYLRPTHAYSRLATHADSHSRQCGSGRKWSHDTAVCGSLISHCRAMRPFGVEKNDTPSLTA